MNTFGNVKTKILNKLTESYANENKSEIKNILSEIKNNKDFKEMYLFYEEIENKYIEDKETAKLYVEGLGAMLNQQSNTLSSFIDNLDKKLGSSEIETNSLYESLDILSEKDSFSNIEKKIVAKKNLVDFLTTKKQQNVQESTVVSNENLLNAVLTNNFNVLYSNTLNEEQKSKLKDILSISYTDLVIKTTELKESVLNSVESLLSESSDIELKNKLNDVKKEVSEMSASRFNYYRLEELKNGLN
jgi:hypothetical protein